MVRKRKEPKKRSGPLKIRPTDDGLHLDGSILWLDSKASGELSFLSSASSNAAPNVPQVIATEETVKILETKRKKPNALVCQYNRPFSIGKLKMELLPSGSVLGGASLYVESDKGRILYAPHLQTQKIPTVRQMQLKKAQTLVVAAYHPDPGAAMPNRRKEKDRFLQTVLSHIESGSYPIVHCNPVSTAQELTKLLSDNDVPVACYRSIYTINRVYEAYGSQLGSYTLFSPRNHKNRVLMLPHMPKMRKPVPDGPTLSVEDVFYPEKQTDPKKEFFISSTCDGKELREVISAVSPKEVYVFGPYAKAYAEDLESVCKNVQPLFSNDQPTLF